MSETIKMLDAWIEAFEPSETNRICKCAGSTVCVYHSGAQIARAYRAALAAASPDREGWQPIETAPKDGRILGWPCSYIDPVRVIRFVNLVTPGKGTKQVWLEENSTFPVHPTHWKPFDDKPPQVSDDEQSTKG